MNFARVINCYVIFFGNEKIVCSTETADITDKNRTLLLVAKLQNKGGRYNFKYCICVFDSVKNVYMAKICFLDSCFFYRRE